MFIKFFIFLLWIVENPCLFNNYMYNSGDYLYVIVQMRAVNVYGFT